MSRRRFLSQAGAATLLAACGSAPSRAGSVPTTLHTPTAGARPIRAIAFDLFTLFDPRGIDARVADTLGAYPTFATTWKTRLFEYCWIRAASGVYVDFARLVHDALVYTAKAHGVTISEQARARLESAFTELAPWPDTREALRDFRARGLQLAPLANYAPWMIERLLAQSGLRDSFDDLISSDRAQTYKPHPRAYALAESAFRLSRDEIAFAAFGGWDAAGARWHGLRTFWVNRLQVVEEQLVSPDAVGSTLADLASWLERARCCQAE